MSEKMPFDQWCAELLAIAKNDGMGGIRPTDYIDYYNDDCTPQDAWDEDWNHAD